MSNDRFRGELNAYETIQSQWVTFVVRACDVQAGPNRIERDDDGSLWLFHEVGDLCAPIAIRDGRMVRILKLRVPELVCGSVH